MKQKILYWVFVFCSIMSFSQQKLSLDENWKFHFGHAADASKDFEYANKLLFHKSNVYETTVVSPKFIDTTWTTVTLPHDWLTTLPFVKSDTHEMDSHGYKPVGGPYPETSIGWYRKHFNVQNSDRDKRFEIQFDGIYRNASIWLNGFYVATNFSGYVGNTYDVTDYINFEGENVLVVRADATQAEGWFYEGAGIYRHVWLLIKNKLHTVEDGLFIHSKVEGDKATVTIESEVINKDLSQTVGILSTYLTDRDGKMVAKAKDQKISLQPNELKRITQNLSLNNFTPWSLENPYLYKVITEIRVSGQRIEQRKTNFGIRTLKFDAEKGFFLNGKPVKIKGTNNHQDHAGVGSALPDFLHYYRIKRLKEMGSNAYRTSHHSPTPELLEACDSLGMLVLDEQRLLNSSPEYVDQFRRLIRRDRNHPSVFLWSIGNEEQNIQGTDYGKRIAQTLLTIQKQEDPTRTSTYAADMGNDFKGVNEVIPIRGFNYRQFAVADYHKDHPNQPVLGTEMGSTVTTRGIYEKDSIRAYVPDQDITAPWWASKAEDWWKLAAENTYWLGGFIWTGFDYRGEPTPYKWPNINSHFGVMDVCGFPKNIYYYYKSWWVTNEEVIHISPHWNWPDKIGQKIEVWVNSNAAEVELQLNGKSLGRKPMPRNGHLNWDVTYEPGLLKAIGYNGSQTFSTVVQTTNKPDAIVCAADKVSMKADGKDGIVLNIAIVDENGLEVPDANNKIEFYIKGDAKIIGVGNGDPSSHEPDICVDGIWQRNCFNGKCQIIIQSGKKASEIEVTAKSNGLHAATIKIQQLP